MMDDVLTLGFKAETNDINSRLNTVINTLNKFSNTLMNVSNKFGNIRSAIDPTIKKIDTLDSRVKNLSKTFINDLNKHLKIEPVVEDKNVIKQLNNLKTESSKFTDIINKLNERHENLKSRGYKGQAKRASITYEPTGEKFKYSEIDKYKEHLEEVNKEIDKLNKKVFKPDLKSFLSDTNKVQDSLTYLMYQINNTDNPLAFAKYKQALKDIANTLNVSVTDLMKFKGALQQTDGTGTNTMSKLRLNINKVLDVFKKGLIHVKNFFSGFKGFGKSAGDMSETLFKKFKKLGLGLMGIRTAMSFLTRSVTSYLSFDQALQDSVSNSWNMMGSLLAPAIEMVANLFATATNYVYNFVKALTGIDLVARANAKALNNQAKATKAAGQAQRSLSSMDEITNLQTESAGGAGVDVPQIEVKDIDTSFIDTLAEEIKKIAEILFEPIKKAWDKVGKYVTSSFKSMLTSLWDLIKAIGKSFAEVWTNGTGERIMTNIFLIAGDLFRMIGNMADAWRKAWESDNTGTNIIQALANALNNILSLIQQITDAFADWWKTDEASLFSESVLSIFETISGWIEYATEKLVNLWDGGFSKVFDGIMSVGTGVVAVLDSILKDLDPVIKFVMDLVTEIGKIVASTIGDVLNGIGDALRWIADNDAALSLIEGLAAALAIYKGVLLAVTVAQSAFAIASAVASGAVGLFGTVMAIAFSPITLIVAGIALVIGALILLEKKTGLVSKTFKAIGEIITKVFTGIIDFFKNNWKIIVPLILGPFIGIPLFIALHFEQVVDFVKEIPEKIREIFEGAVNFIADFINGLSDAILNVVKSIGGFIRDNMKSIALFIMNPFAGIFNFLYDNFEGFRNFVDGIVKGIGEFFVNLWNGIVDKAKDAIQKVKDIFNSIKSFFKGIVDSIFNLFRNIGTAVGNVISGAFKGVVNGVLGAIENILNSPIRAINKLLNIINDVPGVNLKKLTTFNLPRLATGTNYIPEEGVYHLHEGEAVVPKKYNPVADGYDNQADNRQIIDLLIDLNANMLALSEREMAVYMDSRKVAEGIYDDMRTVTKNKNVSNVVTRS